MVDAKLLLGKPVAKALNSGTLERSQQFAQKYDRPPKLAVISVDDPAGQSYLKGIRRTAKKVEAEVEEFPIGANPDISSVQKIIFQLNEDPVIDGVLVQTPLPDGISLADVGNALDRIKDIDGITPYQSGMLFRGESNALVPPTARAVIEMLDFYKYGLKGLEVVIVGRSLVVGKPLGILMLGRHATLTWCHSRTHSLPSICKRAEILVGAVGRPRFIRSNFVRPGATVIDVGINVDDEGKLCGDVDPVSIESFAAAYTPVPGGIGPVTSACLYANLLDAAKVKYSGKS